MSGLNIGVVVDSARKQQHLANMVVQAGHKIGYSCVLNAAAELPVIQQEIEAWVVDVDELYDDTDEGSQRASLKQFLDDLLMQTQVPVIVNDHMELTQGNANYDDGVRRMLQRLERLRGDVNLHGCTGASEVWVLGASTGGPAAVKDFLRQLPPQLGIAFVYVQHINSGQAETLVKMMSAAGHYPVNIARHGSVLCIDTITLFTADCRVNIHENGTLTVGKTAWGGCYSPSIDHVTANVARVYRQRSGIIIFSGMGDDGAASCRLIKQQGGHVWVQSPEQSTIASMPEAALSTGTVSLKGTPVELAEALTRLKNVRKSTHY